MTLSETATAPAPVRHLRPGSLVAAVILALTALVAGALPASAVTQSSAESQFRAVGITWSSSGGAKARRSAGQTQPHEWPTTRRSGCFA